MVSIYCTTRRGTFIGAIAVSLRLVGRNKKSKVVPHGLARSHRILYFSLTGIFSAWTLITFEHVFFGFYIHQTAIYKYAAAQISFLFFVCLIFLEFFGVPFF